GGLAGGEVGTVGLRVLLDRVLALLDLFAQHLDDLDVGQGMPGVEFLVLQRSKDRPQQQGPVLVRGLARTDLVGTQRGGEIRHASDRGGSSAGRRSSCASSSRSASRNGGASADPKEYQPSRTSS